MRILIIDDLRILATPAGAEVVYARNLSQARAALRDGRWDQVWFDHDLGVVDGQVEETQQIADEIEAAARGAADPVDIGETFVHTDNIVGRPRLVAALRDFPCRVVPSAAVTIGRIDDVPTSA